MGRDVNGLTALRQRCAARIPSLDLPIPFDLELFCRSLGERRQRPIVLRPIDIPAGLGGFWVASTQSDYILYQAGARPLNTRAADSLRLCIRLSSASSHGK